MTAHKSHEVSEGKEPSSGGGHLVNEKRIIEILMGQIVKPWCLLIILVKVVCVLGDSMKKHTIGHNAYFIKYSLMSL